MKFRKCDTGELKDIIWRHHTAKPEISNYYLNDLEHLEYFEAGDTLLLRKKAHDFFRIYYYARDIGNLTSLLAQMPSNSVINIPVKRENCEWEEDLAGCGFNLLSRYERWFNPETRIVQTFTGTFAEEKHGAGIKQLFEKNFNKVTDHVPEEFEIAEMIRSKQVLVNLDQEEVQGFFIFTLGKGKCYFNFWFDKGNRGMETLHNVYYLMHGKGIRHSWLWIDSKNERVKKIHKLLGSKSDGLFDFTFSKL